MELKPPAEFGFSGTVKFYQRQDASTITMLKAKGYTVVEHEDPAA